MNETATEGSANTELPVTASPKIWQSLMSICNAGWALLCARWYLRRATTLGERVRVWGKVVVQNKGSLTIEQRVRLAATIVPIELAVGQNATLEIGARTFINYGCSIAATQHVSIGPNCNIGTYVIIMDNDFHRLEPERRQEQPPSAPIVIEENVWLCARVTVLRGVTIGAGSVIAAGSVVVKDIPPRSLAAGSPARVIRQL